MEVHHHPKAEKKSFKEYLLEGLMIFLAVTLGFFAENIRENLSDHAKEMQYLVNIRKDMAADTVNLNSWIPNLFQRIVQYDSLITMLQSPGPVSQGSELYYYARLSTRSRTFDASNNTMIELKNSGNFRLITNQKVIDGLTRFQKTIDNYLVVNAIDIRESDLLYPLLGKLFNASVFNTMIKTDRNASAYIIDTTSSLIGIVSKPPGNPQLISKDPEAINQLIFYLHERKSSFTGEIRLLNEQKREAIEMIKLINTEYPGLN